MTISEKIERIKLLSNNSLEEYSDEVITAFLDFTGKEIISRVYNDSMGRSEVPETYENLQCMAVIIGINQIGAEGGKSYNSNGMSRDFSYGTVTSYISSKLPSMVRVL